MASSSQVSRPPDLGQRLRRSPTPELRRLVEEHGRHMRLGDVRQVLLNPFVSGEVIDELAAVRALVSMYEVRCALARHRRTPEPVAMRFVSGLFWRDLLEVTVDTRLRSSVRRVAEKYLLKRLPRLAVGERVSLARRASPETAAQLVLDPNPRVVAAVLGNPRLTEDKLLLLASNVRSSPRLLQLVADDERWGTRYDVRLALARNPQAPFRVIFDVLTTLRRDDLESVACLESHSSVVRRRARELLDAWPPVRAAADGPDKDSRIAIELGDNLAGP